MGSLFVSVTHGVLWASVSLFLRGGSRGLRIPVCTALCPIFLGLSLSFYGVGHVSTAEKVALSWALGKLKQTKIKTVHPAVGTGRRDASLHRGHKWRLSSFEDRTH